MFGNKIIFSKSQAFAGISAFLLTASLSIAFAAVTQQGLTGALLCVVACSFISLTVKGSLCAPNPLFTVPYYYISLNASPVGAFISIALASAVFTIITNKLPRKVSAPSPAVAGAVLGLCIGATILLTNSYFGIGAYGTTPLEMLKSYRSLGFHPHFMGLLTGTITLFTMITYPFKFKKLSKIIPPAFITLAIPYILNLFLNPDVEYTTINEADFSGFIDISAFFTPVLNYSTEQIPVIVEGFVIFLILFTILNDTSEKCKLQACNIASPFPVSAVSVKDYGILSAVICTALCLILFVLLPQVLHRLPVHSAGAMLIVACWQAVPYKKIAEAFKIKEKRFLNILCFFVCAVAFVILKPYIAAIICILAVNILTPVKKEDVK